MKKLFCGFCVIILMSIGFACADIKLDYDAMTENDLLLLLSEISSELESYGYSVTITKGVESSPMPVLTATNVPAEATPSLASTDLPADDSERSDVVYEHPISIEYASVTNSRGLSSWKDLSISFKNTSDKEIRRVFFLLSCYNRVDEHCWGGEVSSTGPFETNEEYHHVSIWSDVFKDNAASYVVLSRVRIVYMDNTEITIDDPEEIERLYVRD